MLLSDQELCGRLRNFEDPFVERKTENDLKDCLKTAIAFANSLPIGMPGVLFIPATDGGEIQEGVNLDHLQKRISERLAPIYPSLNYFQRILNVDHKQVVAVLVPGSPARPHFSGPAYVRDGSQTKNASSEQFATLIALRSSKVDELMKWLGKRITAEFIAGGSGPRTEMKLTVEMLECNQWYVTLKYPNMQARGVERESFALDRIQISFDQGNQWLSLDIHR